jgi:hypothetical protein
MHEEREGNIQNVESEESLNKLSSTQIEMGLKLPLPSCATDSVAKLSSNEASTQKV